MMIIKLKDGTYNVFDTLGGMGIWNINSEELSKYLNLIKQIRKISQDDVRNYPLLESAIRSPGLDPLPPIKTDDPFINQVFQQKLPLRCFFDTDIVLSNAEKYGEGIITPPSVSLDVNKVCNFSCKWCCADYESRPLQPEMSTEDIADKVLKPLINMGNLSWYLVGGEPGLTPEKTAAIAGFITRYTAHCSAEQPLIALDTNGTNFVKNAGLFKESGINTIQFSLSSSSAAVDRYFRGIPSGINPVRLIKEALAKAKSLNMHCGINMVIWKESEVLNNFEDIEEVIDLAYTLNTDFIRITPSVAVGAAARNGINLSIDEMKYIAHKISHKRYIMDMIMDEIAGTKIIGISPEYSMGENSEIPCDLPLTCRAGTCFLHIDSFGYVYPCALVVPDFCAGNVRQGDIGEIWRFSPVMQEWRTVFDICEECARCSQRDYCISVCPAHAWFKFKSIDLRERPAECPAVHAC